MPFEFLSRRQFFGYTGALVLTAIAPGLVHSASEPPINDVLSGVGDAADRQRLRQEADKGQWDGQYWNKDDKRYTSASSSGPPRLQPALSSRYARASSGHGAQSPGRARSLQPEQSVSASASRSGTRSRRLRQRRRTRPRRRNAPVNPFSLVFQPAENRQGIFCILAVFLCLTIYKSANK